MRICTIGLMIAFTLGVLAASLPADAQPAGKIRRIGFLALQAPPESSAETAARVEAFRQGLRDFGWIEGQNIAIEYRWAAGRSDRLPALAEELVRLQVDLIVAGGGNVVQAVQDATTTIPIVMPLAADVVETGLVASLARPGGNITGQSDSAIELDGKLLELLKETLPQVTRVAILWEASVPYFVRRFRATQDAAQALGFTIQSLALRHPDEFDRVLEAAAQGRAEALVVWGIIYSPFGPRIAAFAATHRVPVVSNNGAAVEQHFGLMAYAVNSLDMHRRVASYVDKILRGRNDLSFVHAHGASAVIVDCLVIGGADCIHAAKQATSTIPIVMLNTSDDPVRLGLITSFARPGGNITGVVDIAEQLAGKRLELLKEAFPYITRVGHLLKTAQAVGLTIPPPLLFQADEVSR